MLKIYIQEVEILQLYENIYENIYENKDFIFLIFNQFIID
jgi:hypothetical protein